MKEACQAGGLCAWRGLEVSLQLGQLYQQNPEVRALMARPCRAAPTVSIGVESSVPCPPLYLHHSVSFSPTCCLNIHTVCAMIEALDLYGKFREALHLTVRLAISIVSFYERVILKGRLDGPNLPIAGTCFFGKTSSSGKDEDMADKIPGSQEGTTSREDAPVNTVTVATFAFLFEALSKGCESADTVIRKLSPQRPRSSKSLMLQLGLLGLFFPKRPASTKQSEVCIHAPHSAWSCRMLVYNRIALVPAPLFSFWFVICFPVESPQVRLYDCESWLTSKLVEMKPSDPEKEFLSSLAKAVLSSTVPWPAPPSSLARVVFHHLFAGASANCDATFTPSQTLALDVALRVLASGKNQSEIALQTGFVFEYALCRLWAKLAATVLRALSVNKPLLDRVMACVLGQDGPLGRRGEENRTATDAASPYRSNRDSRRVEMKCDVAGALGRVFVTDSLDDSRGNAAFFTVSARLVRTHHAQEGGKSRGGAPSGASDPALALCAIQLGAHSLWLQKGQQGTSYSRREALG